MLKQSVRWLDLQLSGEIGRLGIAYPSGTLRGRRKERSSQ